MAIKIAQVIAENEIGLFTQKQGNAWENIYDQYAPMIYGICKNMLSDEKTAALLFTKAFEDMHNQILNGAMPEMPLGFIKNTYKIVIEYIAPEKPGIFAKQVITTTS